jgi:hypothetical protein
VGGAAKPQNISHAVSAGAGRVFSIDFRAWLSSVDCLVLRGISRPIRSACVGVPFMIAALQLERGHWVDYTGFLTMPALVGNLAVAFLLPQLIVAGLWRILRVRP